MTTDETLDLALEALKSCSGVPHWPALQPAITAIKQARSAPVLDSTCNETLRAQGKAYPRTCRKCGLGPCIGAPKQLPAAQPTTEESSAVKPAAPVQDKCFLCGERVESCTSTVCPKATPPAAPVQEPDHGNELTIAYMSGLHDGKKKREWASLTESDRRLISYQWQDGNGTATEIIDLVEAKLKEKNT